MIIVIVMGKKKNFVKNAIGILKIISEIKEQRIGI